VPVEAHACGSPVVALGRGGATETVVPPGAGREPTGLWFDEPATDCLAEAILAFEARRADFNPAAARRPALRLNTHRFRQELLAFLDGLRHPAAHPVRRAA